MSSEGRERFISISESIPDVLLDIRYYSSFNFIGERIDGYQSPIALIVREAENGLKKASSLAISHGCRLKIFDAYRPQSAVSHFERWAKDLNDTRMKAYFYPEVDKARLFDLGYIASRSGHSRGSSIDLTLFDMTAGHDRDMGGPFDYFGDLSHPDYREITQTQYDNRMLLRDIMVSSGFLPIRSEWWHFNLKDEPYPDTYFDFPVL